MPVAARGFSLIETLIAMAIGAVLLLGAARFLPALQRQVLRQTQQQALENDSTDGIPSLIRHSWLKASCLELEIMDTVRRQQKILFPADH